MALVENEILIDGPTDKVFDAVTTTETWPRWHPATIAVGGVTDRPIQLGDRIYEKARIGNQEYEGEWTVVEHVRPSRVVIQVMGMDTRISYTFTAIDPSKTRFVRGLEFDPVAFAGSAANAPAVEKLMYEQSQTALQNLKNLVEESLEARQG